MTIQNLISKMEKELQDEKEYLKVLEGSKVLIRTYQECQAKIQKIQNQIDSLKGMVKL